jgi:hypothetical protein
MSPVGDPTQLPNSSMTGVAPTLSEATLTSVAVRK